MNSVRISVLFFCLTASVLGAEKTQPKDTRMPPRGIAVPSDVKSQLNEGVAALGREIEQLRASLKSKPALLELLPDVQIYHNAVRYALEDDIFYRTNDFAIAQKLLKEGRERTRQLAIGKAPWNTATGLVVRGYISKLDGSVQPYGLVVPASYHANASKQHRLDFWFHGRGETLSELSFINERESKVGEFSPADTFVLHPYGRYCNAYKFAGERDVFEALENVEQHYSIDTNRISVRGFSMGGAATWHLAAHHAGLWAAASPGAGFVDAAIYLKMPEKTPFPAWYEQKLWHLYNSIDYAANLFNCGLVAYSGEIDPQKQAADLMSKAMDEEGLQMTHIIGPNTAHKYEPKAKLEVIQKVDAIANAGRDPVPRHIKFTTWTLRYNQMKWVIVDGLEQHWNRARVDAEIVGDYSVHVTTTNVTALTLSMPANLCPLTAKPTVVLDGHYITGPAVASDRSWTAHFQKKGDKWLLIESMDERDLRKRHGLQGPIDDAFMDSFIMVRPTGKPQNPAVASWINSEMTNALEQWHLQFRGDARVKDDADITDADIAASNLILWGDPQSNRLLAKIASRLPLQWSAREVRVHDKTFVANKFVPVIIYPNPLNPKRYIVINSSFTFSEMAHSSNAQQIPKLPDYAVLDITVPREKRGTDGVATAGFFNERWKFSALDGQ